MGASVSSLVVPHHPPLQEKTNVLSSPQGAMISQATPLSLHQRVRLNGTTKSRPALVSPVPLVDRDTYSASSKSLKAGSRPAHDEHLFSRSKSKVSPGPIAPPSRVYPTVSTLPRLPDANDRPPKTQNHSLPRRGPTSIPDSTQRLGKPSSAAIRTPSRVDTPETRKRSHQTSEARSVIKSPSRSTIDSSSKASSSSLDAFSSRDEHRHSSSRLDHEEVDGYVKRRRTVEEIKLKPIREVEIEDYRLQDSTGQLPSRPPGLGNSANSTGVQAPATTTSSPAKILLHSQTKSLSQILDRSSLVILSPPSRRVDHSGSAEISVKEQNDRQVNPQDSLSHRVVSLKDIYESTSTPGSEGPNECIGEHHSALLPNARSEDVSEDVQAQELCAGMKKQELQKFLSLPLYLSDPDRLSGLLQYLSFPDWCSLFNTSKEIRLMVSHNELLKEEVLERFLREVGYCRWVWRESEPITISLTDMFHYLKGIFTPTGEYVEVAQQFLKSQPNDNEDDIPVANHVSRLAHATRSYNRLVLRLRAQAEMVEHCDIMSSSDSNSSTSPSSRRSSYYPIPDMAGSTSSFISGGAEHSQRRQYPSPPSDSTSPLYRPNRAALLRVFVPSSQGEWLSDASVLECEAELKRAELTRFMKFGDVVWDTALGGEKGNSGKLIWDGCYLLDLDYTYSSTGDIPRHIPSLALPPSYFHGIIQRGPLNMDPIIRMDVSPWGEEIARNLQLMQDKMMADTPQGLQNVVRWVHRTTFTIRPPLIRGAASSSGQRMVHWAQTGIPIRDSNGQMVHSSWYGSLVIETDGTSESLDDLKERCGLGVFPPRVVAIGRHGKQRECHERMVWRILREKSRPGEIWMKVITPRERLM